MLTALHDAILENGRRYDHNRSWRAVCQNISENNVRSLVRVWNSPYVQSNSTVEARVSLLEKRTFAYGWNELFDLPKVRQNVPEFVVVRHSICIFPPWMWHLRCMVAFVNSLDSKKSCINDKKTPYHATINLSFMITYTSLENIVFKLQLCIIKQWKMQSIIYTKKILY